MKFISTLAVGFCLFAGPLVAAESSHKLKEVKGLPKELSPKIAAVLHESGQQVTGPDGALCVVWLAKDLAVKPKFKPSQSVAYPFTHGQLLGAIQFPEGSSGFDFRSQEIPTGVYTLRYGQQPEDGNHLGTSEIRDFCMALPAEHDKDPKPIFNPMQLNEQSAEAAGSTHPAIFLMSAPPEKPEKESKIIHDEDHDFQILQLTTTGKAADKPVPLLVRIVVVGAGE
ncbi:hypothetical protein Mal52_18760 [Symmachiella dynata]|uniref:DUF4198 domain-containing protein n=1 Tax=Symmachiella dynata TaxID=2527995 RepID=A0A517ZLN3_9PLAN|nr:hypothetical protein [Symmachiella dynata]QDU43402.1 hypothetical protein Mal52_18760 [Symmachiella dynata]